jgi:hypothetical protein
MGGFLRALEKVGLVKVEGGVEGMRPEPVLEPEPTVASPAETKPVEMQSDGVIVEGQPFESFYSGLPASG